MKNNAFTIKHNWFGISFSHEIIWSVLLICAQLFFSVSLFSQANQLLNKPMEVHTYNRKVIDILDEISQKYKVSFSYNSELIPSNCIIKTEAKDKSLAEMLDLVLNNPALNYNELESQIIIYKTEKKRTKTNKETYFLLRGNVLDQATNSRVSFANIFIENTTIGTITNSEGEFVLKIPLAKRKERLSISCMGYNPCFVRLDSLHSFQLNIVLSPMVFSIEEVVVKYKEPLEIIRESIEKIPQNYHTNPEMYTAFYREFLTQDTNYVVLLEAILKIYKTAYNSVNELDCSKMVKGRKGENVNDMKTVQFKLQGGVATGLNLDIVRYHATFLSEGFFEFYNYELSDIINYQGNETYVITFDQNRDLKYPLHKGKVYIDVESKAIVKAEFGISPTGLKYANKVLIVKCPLRFRIKPIYVNYIVNYRKFNDKWYLNHVRSELKIKVRQRKKLFNSEFTSISELAITERDSDNIERIRSREQVKEHDIFTEIITRNDESYWGNYNIIKPNDSIEDAVREFAQKEQSKLNVSK